MGRAASIGLRVSAPKDAAEAETFRAADGLWGGQLASSSVAVLGAGNRPACSAKATRFRPARLASYRARSARASTESRRRSCVAAVQTPKEAVTSMPAG